jgi:hypothetical protein
MYGVDSTALSLQIDTWEHPGRDLWGKGYVFGRTRPWDGLVVATGPDPVALGALWTEQDRGVRWSSCSVRLLSECAKVTVEAPTVSIRTWGHVVAYHGLDLHCSWSRPWV